jgi:virulence factor Mce-like protein
MNRRHLTSPLPVLVAVLALVAGACAQNDGTLVLEAVFDDVNELVPRHQVMTSDVPIGQVTEVELTDDNRAFVRMEVQDVGLPEDVRAEVAKTQVLGEQYVNIVPLSEEGRLASGRIEETAIRGELEDLIGSGTDFLAYLAADQLSAAVHAGAITFADRGGTFGSLLNNLEVFVGTFSQREEDIIRLLDGFDELLAGVAPAADQAGEAVEALARSAAALEQEDERFLDALEDLRRLAVVGERIMREHRQEIDGNFTRIRELLAQLTRYEGALDGFLTWWPRHNLHVANELFNEHAQLHADIIICNTFTEERDNPTMSCDPPNPGQTGTERPDYEPDECDVRHENCPYPEGVEPRTERGG